MDNYIFKACDSTGNEYIFDRSSTDRGLLLTLKKENIKSMRDIYALGEFTAVNAGDYGYYLLPRNDVQTGDILTEFKPREDIDYRHNAPMMAFLGLKKDGVCCLIRIERNYPLSFNMKIKGGKYELTAVFGLESDYTSCATPAEDINIEIIFLDNSSDCNDIAKAEREIRLERGEITPLTEKCKRDAVEYARKYPLVRIRNGWKQCPSPIKHQTVENEPPMHVACDFKRVRELADEFKRQGIEGAEFQLVGWNISGHDGRWPQTFPIEEKFGGEAGITETAEYIKSLGYRFSLHDNISDAYEIADSFSWDNITKTVDGEYKFTGDYAAGSSYNICPIHQLENARERMPKLRELGVNGIHYTDVLSIVQPFPCHNEAHPLNFKKSLDKSKEIMGYIKSVFGAFSSEGAMDFSIEYIDYALYATFGSGFGNTPPAVADKLVNMFEVIYHGILLYNPFSTTVNYPIKHPAERLTLIMRGGKPSIYFYSKYCSGEKKNWMGEIDFTCDSDNDMRLNVSHIKRMLEDYEPLRDLQFEYMDRYDFLDDGLEMATYQNGVRLIGNFTDEVRYFEDEEIEPYGYIMLK